MMMANRLKNLAENTCNINGLKINFRLVTLKEGERQHGQCSGTTRTPVRHRQYIIDSGKCLMADFGGI